MFASSRARRGLVIVLFQCRPLTGGVDAVTWRRSAKVLRMPRLSPTATRSRILHIHLEKNEVVKSYDLALTLSVDDLTFDSDSATTEMELEILEDGFRVAELLVEAGRDVEIGEPLAILIDEGLPEAARRLAEVKSELDLFDSCLMQAYIKAC